MTAVESETAWLQALSVEADVVVPEPVPGRRERLVVEIAGLQQAFRIKQAEWSATMSVEALGQSLQADVFHLYSLKEGVVYGSVLLNYFVVGAPANEWRIELPEGIGNVEVTGQQVEAPAAAAGSQQRHSRPQQGQQHDQNHDGPEYDLAYAV